MGKKVLILSGSPRSGGNSDLLCDAFQRGASASETAARMEAFLNQRRSCYPSILLVAPPPMKRGAWVPNDELVNESIHLVEKYKKLAGEGNIPFADTRGWNMELAFDGVHFTEKGHHTFAAKIASILQPQLYTSP